MIGEIGSGSSFRGLLHYLFHGSAATEPREPTWVEVRNLFTPDRDRLHKELAATASQNTRAQQPVLHVIVSPAPEDHLTREQWSALADRVLTELGLGEHQAVVVHHSDTSVPHLHLAVNRIHPEKLTAWPTWRSKTRLEGILRQIERDWDLRRVQGRLASEERASERPTEHTPSTPTPRPVRAQARHRAEEPRILAWRRTLLPHFEAATSWSDLAVRLQANGVRLEARGRGLVVTDGEVYAKASSIDRAYSRGRLEERFDQPFSAWRQTYERFDAAASVYARYAHRGPDHPRASAALRALQSTGATLGWRTVARLSGPLAPAVGAVALATSHAQARAAARRRREEAWTTLLERHAAPALLRSASWSEAEGRLRYHGLWLGRADSGRGELTVTDGLRARPLRALGPGLTEDRLRARLGSWEAWHTLRAEILGRARRLHRFDASIEQRTERWTRLTRLIQRSELRLERHRALRAQLDATEQRLRTLLRDRLPRRATPAEVRRLLRAIRRAPEHELPALLGRPRPRLLRRDRDEPLPEELRRTVGSYRALARRVVHEAPAARSARRRLPQLRRRARLLNPRQYRARLRDGLLTAARKAGRIGLYSLIARAAPGLGSALTLVRLTRRLHRQLERGEHSR